MAPRKKKAAANSNAPPAAGGKGHNIGELDDDQRQALTRQHATRRAQLVAELTTARSNLKTFDSIVRSDLGPKGLADIKMLEELESNENSEKDLQGELDRLLRLARWAGLEVGHQANLFAEQERPLRDRAFDEGKRAGFAGEPGKAPANYSPGSDGEQGWLEGWHRGQEILAQQSIKPTNSADSGLIRGPGNEEPKSDAFDADDASSEWPDDRQAQANKAGNANGAAADQTVTN